MAVSGDTIVVGTPNKASSSGAVYVFVRSGTTWKEQQKFTGSRRFGISVAINGDTFVVGADDSGGTLGSAYVFARNGTTWSQQQRFTASDVDTHYFGISVAISGKTILVSGHNTDREDYVDYLTGVVYIYVRSDTSWSEQQKLTLNRVKSTGIFHISVAIGGDTAAIGTLYDETTDGINAGSAYVFVRNESM
jgi:FG-GAP repeat